MKVNFKQPKYVLPLVVLPFFFFGFYVYSSNFKPKEVAKKQEGGMQESIGDVSTDVKNRTPSDKLDAYRNKYKEADGLSSINTIDEEKPSPLGAKADANLIKQRRLDSINDLIQSKLASTPKQNHLSGEDKTLALALSKLGKSNKHSENQPMNTDVAGEGDKPHDPMETFRKQMGYLDSMKKANDPEYKAEMQKKLVLERAQKALKDQHILGVQKADETSSAFNTISVKKEKDFIKAIVDENVTGYAGSRIRIRLLDDINAGSNRIPKGTYIYAEISGFSEQRVMLTITSILSNNKILPVKLSVYDLDGMPGLYVPASAFREFSKDLGTNTIQGVNIDNGASQSFSMSMMDKVFQSTSSAVAELIRKNKAKVKYDTFVYLIDPQELKNEQKNY